MSVNEGYKSHTARTRFKMAAAFENPQRNGALAALYGIPATQGSQLDVMQASSALWFKVVIYLTVDV